MYKTKSSYAPSKTYLRGNKQCKLALQMLSKEVYEKEWDIIMIDALRGYFPEAPGRMAVIFSAAMMARQRKGSGVTLVFLHDVDQRVEKALRREVSLQKVLEESCGLTLAFRNPIRNESNQCR